MPPIGGCFMYIESSAGTLGNQDVFVSFEGAGFVQIINISFYYNRFSNLTNKNIKAKRSFRIKHLLNDTTWSTR